MTKEHRPHRRTMIKSTVGTVKRSDYDLPDAKNPSHVYGYEVPRDPENAGQVISRWVHATPSVAANAGRSFIETNRQAILHGCINAGETRRFANQHPGIVVKPAEKCKRGYVPTNDTTYGIKSQESEDIWGLVQARYTSYRNDNADYPDLSGMKAKGKLPLPRETRSSIIRDVRNYPVRQEKKLFKMTKFRNVDATMYTQPNAASPHKREEHYYGADYGAGYANEEHEGHYAAEDHGQEYGGSQHGGSQHGGSQQGGSQYGGSQYGGSQYGGSQYGGSQYGEAHDGEGHYYEE